MQPFLAIFGATMIALAAGAATPAGAENVLRWPSAVEALTFDPHSVNHTSTINANSQVYEPLVDFNSRFEIEPSLVVRWKLTDATTWQLDLRRSVRSHDGAPFAAEDVVFSLNRVLSKTRITRRTCASAWRG